MCADELCGEERTTTQRTFQMHMCYPPKQYTCSLIVGDTIMCVLNIPYESSNMLSSKDFVEEGIEKPSSLYSNFEIVEQ